MNPLALVRKTQRVLTICPTWRDRWERIKWLYPDQPFVRPFLSGTHQIKFRYPSPVNEFELVVRDNNGADSFIFGEVFNHLFYDFELPFTPLTILDLGANAGFTTIFFARKYPDAHLACVEPMPNNLEILKSNLALNHVPSTVFASAISAQDGTVQMVMTPFDHGHKVAGIATGKALKGELLDVHGISVPTLMRQMRWERIGLLKVDIEGYEAVLLKENCDWLSRVDAMCIECHEGYDESDLNALTRAFAFNPPIRLPGIWLLVSSRFN